MKLLEIILFILLLSVINSACIPDEEDLPKIGKIRDYEDCEKRTTDEELSSSGAYKCCLFYYYLDTYNLKSAVYTCDLITKDQYDHIKDTIKKLEKEKDIEDVEIDCKASYFKISIILLLSLLFSNKYIN